MKENVRLARYTNPTPVQVSNRTRPCLKIEREDVDLL